MQRKAIEFQKLFCPLSVWYIASYAVSFSLSLFVALGNSKVCLRSLTPNIVVSEQWVSETHKKKNFMASNGNIIRVAQPLIPIFKGEGYEFWRIRMKTLLKSQHLWDYMESGYIEPDEENILKENKMDSKAPVIIQQVVHDSIFSRIAAATASKQARCHGFRF